MRQHYLQRGRYEAAANLTQALRQARRLIASKPQLGLPAPRPYPQLARPGEAWLQVGRYWIAYTTTEPIAILAIFYDGSDIPGRR